MRFAVVCYLGLGDVTRFAGLAEAGYRRDRTLYLAATGWPAAWPERPNVNSPLR
jgi:hypothetical protein